IEFVAAPGTVLDFPDLAGLRMQRQALRVAVAVGEDLGPHARSTDKGIVRRHRAVVLQAHDLARQVRKILRLLHLEAIAASDVHQPGAVEQDARAELEAATPMWQRLEEWRDRL